MSDPIKTLGRLLKKEDDHQRDAIHIAIFPAYLAQEMYRGTPVKLKYGTKDQVVIDPEEKGIGILDPYLKEYYVPKGSRVWIFLHPGSIVGLRHDWSHPEIDKKEENPSESEVWLHEFAEKWHFDYEELIKEASSKPNSEWGNYITAMGKDLHSASELGEDHELFWYHLQKLTKKSFDQDHKDNFGWSCSC